MTYKARCLLPILAFVSLIPFSSILNEDKAGRLRLRQEGRRLRTAYD